MFVPENSVFVPFFLFSLSCCAVCAWSSFDLSALLPTYNQGVNNYNSILKSLVNLNTSAETTSDAVFFQDILQYAKSSLNGFSQCAALATTKGDAFAAEELRRLSQLSNKKQSLRAKEQEYAEQQQKLNSARNRLSTQTKRRQSAMNTLYRTQIALEVAQKKVDDANNCVVRRKRGLGDLFKKVGNVVTKSFDDIAKKTTKSFDDIAREAKRICVIALNELTGHRNKARKAQKQARTIVIEQQNRVNTAQHQVSLVQNKLNQLIHTEAILKQDIEKTKKEIAEFKAQREKVSNLKGKLQQVSTHLGAVLAPYEISISAIQTSRELSVLVEVEGLLSLESLIGQLQDVAEGLSGSAGNVVPRFMQITNEEKQRLESQIEAFREKLRQFEEKQNKESQLSDKGRDVTEDFN